jgi:hypothetical protein
MRRWIVFSFLTALVFALACPCLAQNQVQQKKPQFPLELSIFNHAITMPFNGIILNPIHPGFSLGTEYHYTEGRLGCLFQSIHAGYYFNKYNARALFIKTEIGYRYTVKFGLFGDVTLGTGYLHSFHPTEVYKLNAQGKYEKAKDKGKGAVIFLISLGIGYDFSQKVEWPVSVFFRYQPYCQTPYNLKTSVLPQSMVHIGVRVSFVKRSNR